MQTIVAIMQRDLATLADLPWDDVRLFLALCRSRTLGEAGQRLRVDASTMSRRLGGLEAALGAPLFERGRSGILATEAAERLLPLAEEMEALVARFRGEAETFERDVSGRVRVACPADLAELVLAPLLPTLLQRHPRLQVDIVAGERLVDMARRDADLALRTVRPTRGELVVSRLSSVSWRIAVAPHHPSAARAIRRLADIPWVAFTEDLAGSTPARWASEHLAGITPVLRSDSLTVQLSAVRGGVGAALVPEGSMAPYGLTPLRLGKALRVALGRGRWTTSTW